MATGDLPAYLTSAKPNPLDNRGPWYANIAPSYAGIFLWIAFYDPVGNGFKYGGLAGVLLGLVLAGLICHLLFYYVFGLLGMRTGLPLYVVGSSTFGTKGGLLFPGIFMGLLQIGWYSVATYYATGLVLGAFGAGGHVRTILDPMLANRQFDVIFVVTAIIWGYVFAFLGALGIKYVARMSQFFPIIPLAMLVVAALMGVRGLGSFKTSGTFTLGAVLLMIQSVVGFFATAGAAGVDFGTAAREDKDVRLGGLFGIALAILVTRGLAATAVAGAHGIDPNLASWRFWDALPVVSPTMAKFMLLLFAIGSMAPASFCASIIGNSLSTMMPSLPRIPLTLAGATIGIILAGTGAAANLEPFFGLIGASFGPICGAMVADYLVSGRKWAGPREGVSVAGYAAWVIGFLVGISNNAVLGKLAVMPEYQPAAVYSFVVGFAVYYVLAKAGLQGRPVTVPGLTPAVGAEPAAAKVSA